MKKDGLAGDDELNADQLAAMDSLWRAKRANDVSDDDANHIEAMVRRGHPHGALKRLTRSRRAFERSGESMS